MRGTTAPHYKIPLHTFAVYISTFAIIFWFSICVRFNSHVGDKMIVQVRRCLWILWAKFSLSRTIIQGYVFQSFIFLLTISASFSAPTPHAEPNPAPAADPAPKPGLMPLVYSPPMVVSYNPFSALQTPSASLAVVRSAPAAVLPAGVQTVPTLYAGALGTFKK